MDNDDKLGRIRWNAQSEDEARALELLDDGVELWVVVGRGVSVAAGASSPQGTPALRDGP